MSTENIITNAARQMHETADMLQASLATARPLEARQILALLASLRRVADDADQLANDIRYSAVFTFCGAVFGLEDGLRDNEDTPDVCDWMRSANVGDIYMGCKRIA